MVNSIPPKLTLPLASLAAVATTSLPLLSTNSNSPAASGRSVLVDEKSFVMVKPPSPVRLEVSGITS